VGRWEGGKVGRWEGGKVSRTTPPFGHPSSTRRGVKAQSTKIDMEFLTHEAQMTCGSINDARSAY